jgi:hypothetical protein
MGVGPSAPTRDGPLSDTPGRYPRSAPWRRITRLEPSARAWVAFAVLLVLAAVLVYHETRERTLWADEWTWALERRGSDVDTFLRPHNEHLSLVPIGIYKVLFATAGISHYAPYRVVLIVAQLVCAVLIFVYASRRAGGFVALLGAALILFFGQGFQVILWPFQIAWLISLAAGIGALLMLDRADRRGDIAASMLLAVSLASSGLGIPIAVGLAVDVLWGRRQWRDAWIFAAPVALYALWWLAYQPGDLVRRNILAAPSFIADEAASVMSSLVGLGGQTVDRAAETPLGWGRPLAIVAAAVVAWRLAGLRTIPPRVLTLLTILLSFWLLTALARAHFANPYESRYLYVGGVLVVLLGAELARRISLPWRTSVLLGVAVALAVLSNIGALRAGARFLRDESRLAAVELGAMELARPVVRSDFVSGGFPFGILRAGPYFAAADELGTPAATPAEIAGETEGLRQAADDQLRRIHEIDLDRSRASTRPASGPAIDAVAGGSVRKRGPCVSFRPAGLTPAGVSPELQLTVPPTGLRLTAEDGPAAVSARRFADTFPSRPQATLAPGADATMRIPRDLAPQPWHARVRPAGRVTVCGLG